MKKIITIVSCFGVGLFLSSCWPADLKQTPSPTPFVASPTPSPEIPQPLTACDLITRTQAETIVGEALLEPKQSAVNQESELSKQGCLFLAASGAFTPSVQINLIYTPYENQQLLETTWQATQSAEKAYPRYEDITTLPVRAYFGTQSLQFQQQNYIISVMVSMKDTTQNRATTLLLTEQILANWPSL